MTKFSGYEFKFEFAALDFIHRKGMNKKRHAAFLLVKS